tara:strand:+ start:92 stop:274 length:183 start_codon:yes stop_codon:yes gene_type:complete
MKTYFEHYCVDVMVYNKYYNPKIKYLEKNILYDINYDKIDEDDCISRYDEYDYDTINDLQ